jgi:glycosyltransferase involved in cell wall biosynthesis
MQLVDEAAANLGWPVLMAGKLEQAGASSTGSASRPKHAYALGHLDANAVKSTLGRASIYVHPARYEPFGLAVLEAAMAGCALVLGDIPSLREIWQDAAIFVPVGDAKGLTALLEELIRDGTKRLALADLARGRARRYTPHRMLSEYLAAYRQALARPTAYREKEKSACA